MISHKYRCIFIHVPRTAGSSIEKWIAGDDWWEIDPQSKHLTALQAQKRYESFWDEYFKFSFVRHPVGRSVSLLGYGEFYGVSLENNDTINFDKYHENFGRDVICEHDYRYGSKIDAFDETARPGAIYGNIIGKSLDFIGKFETFNDDISYLRSILSIKDEFYYHVQQSRFDTNSLRLSSKSLAKIRRMYRNDFLDFHYE